MHEYVSALTTSLLLIAYLYETYYLGQGSGAYGPRAGSGPPSKIIRPVAPLQNCSNYSMYSPPSGIIFHESVLLSTSCIAYLWGNTYEKQHCVINVMYVTLWAFVMNCENQELIWLKFPRFIHSINGKGNVIICGNLARPALPCRVCFWPATRERFPTPDLGIYSNNGTMFSQRFSCRIVPLVIPCTKWKMAYYCEKHSLVLIALKLIFLSLKVNKTCIIFIADSICVKTSPLFQEHRS